MELVCPVCGAESPSALYKHNNVTIISGNFFQYIGERVQDVANAVCLVRDWHFGVVKCRFQPRGIASKHPGAGR